MRTGSTGRAAMMVVALAVALATVAVPAAQARVWCNTAKSTDAPLNQGAAKASARFLTGASQAMAMLAALEASDPARASRLGKTAAAAFNDAADLFDTVAATFRGKDAAKFQKVDLRQVAKFAVTAPRTPPFLEVAKRVQSDDPGKELMNYCASEARRFADSTEAFLNAGVDSDAVGPVTDYLLNWSRVIYVGRVVSAFFAVAGGEK
jgi:hypothetical protein